MSEPRQYRDCRGHYGLAGFEFQLGQWLIRERELERFTLPGVRNVTGRIPILSVLQAQPVVFRLIVGESLAPEV